MSAVTRTRSPFGGALLDLLDKMRHLSAGGMDFDYRIDQTGRADDLLDDLAAGFFEFVIGGRGGNEDRLRRAFFPLLEPERPVVERAGQPEAVLDERHFAAAVAGVHRPDLRNGHVRFVDKQQVIVREEIEQAYTAARRALGPERYRL